MGVRGLTSFVTNLPSAWVSLSRKVDDADKEKTVRLVGDGKSMIFELEQLCNMDWRFHDYRNFAAEARKLIQGLISAGFSLHVVLNGMPAETKIEFHNKREMEIIQRISRFLANPAEPVPKGKEVMPKLVFQVFMQVLREMKIHRTVCDGEASAVIEWTSRQHNCNVVCLDSDFFINNNPGYIPLDTLKITPQGVVGRKFNKDKFAEEIKLKPSMLPLFAAVVGSDNISDADLRRLQRHIFKSHPPPANAGTNYKHALIRSIGNFLGTFGEDQDAALDEIERILAQPPEVKPAQKWGEDDGEHDGELEEDLAILAGGEYDFAAEAKRIRNLIATAASAYKPPASDPLENNANNLLKPACPEDWENGYLPAWLVDGYRRGEIEWKAMLLITKRRFWCHGIVENIFEKPSAYLASRPLRQLMYAVLFKSDETSVQEHLRDGLSFGPKDVFPIRKAPGSGETIPHLSQLVKKTPEERLRLLFGILGIGVEQETAISALHPILALPVALMSWWIRDSATPIPVYDVVAILAAHSAPGAILGASTDRKSTHFSRHAAHLCAMWTGISEAGNLLNCTLLNPLQSSWSFDGHHVHQLYEGLRRSQKDVHNVVANIVGSVETFWLMFSAATMGCRDHLDGRVEMSEDNRLVLTRAVNFSTGGARPGGFSTVGSPSSAGGPNLNSSDGGAAGFSSSSSSSSAAANAANAAGLSSSSSSLGASGKKQKVFDASVKKPGSSSEKREAKVGTIFAALRLADDNEDNEDGNADEHDGEKNANEDGHNNDATESSNNTKNAEPEKTPEEIAAARAKKAAKENKKKNAKKESGEKLADDVNNVLAELEAIDKAEAERKAKKLEKKKR